MNSVGHKRHMLLMNQISVSGHLPPPHPKKYATDKILSSIFLPPDRKDLLKFSWGAHAKTSISLSIIKIVSYAPGQNYF